MGNPSKNMSNCPVPHCARDYTWLGVGAGVGALAAYLFLRNRHKYEPPKVWKSDTQVGGKFAKMNSATAGARFQKDLPDGEHDIQLYSFPTPNGAKVTILLEEICQVVPDFDYDAWRIEILSDEPEQFTSGFCGVNPNSKIPALVDKSTSPPTNVFESGSIL